MSQPFGFGIVCQPQSESVPSGVVCSNASGNVCKPVASTVKANPPLPTDSGLAASKFVSTTSCRVTSACRSMGAAFAVMAPTRTKTWNTDCNRLFIGLVCWYSCRISRGLKHFYHMAKLFLGLDSSTQSLSAVVIDLDARKVVYETSLNFDRALPHYKTRNGVLPNRNPLVKHSSPLMWAEALDLIFTEMKRDGVALGKILAVSGSGQQHGSVYFNDR